MSLGATASERAVELPPPHRPVIISAKEAAPMPAEAVERRLTAILAADIAGYSRLVGLDEEGTLARLKALRRELIDPTISSHRGRIVQLSSMTHADANE